MQTPPLDPDIADVAPSGTALTSYDNEHVVTYLRLLDAHAEGVDWREVARVVLHLDPEHECDRAHKAFDSHLSRAKWQAQVEAEHAFTRIRDSLSEAEYNEALWKKDGKVRGLN
jgi:hypothetical protein